MWNILYDLRESTYGSVNNNNLQTDDNCGRRVVVSRASLYLSTGNSFRPDTPHDAWVSSSNHKRSVISHAVS